MRQEAGKAREYLGPFGRLSFFHPAHPVYPCSLSPFRLSVQTMKNATRLSRVALGEVLGVIRDQFLRTTSSKTGGS
jgi:hypothetical protein